MYYFYVLKSKNPKYKNKFYRGYSSNLVQRLEQHNLGYVKSTSNFKPWKIIYYEAYLNENQARNRELVMKQRGKVWQNLKKRLTDSM